MWNFHCHVAVRLELDARELLPGSTFSADYIECGGFVYVMYAILDHLKINDYGDFVALCNDYTNKPASEIPIEEVKKMYAEFCKLIGKNY